MFGLPVIDIVVIVAYFLGMIGIGLWSMRSIKSEEDYFLAGRGFGKLVQIFAAFGQSTTADNSVGATTTTFTNGAAGIWSSLLYLPATPLYWLVAPWMRRLRMLTLGDFYKERYGSRRLAALYAVLGSICMMAYLSVGFSAMSKTVVALTPKQVIQMTPAEQTEHAQAQELDVLRSTDYTSLSAPQQARLKELQIRQPRKIFSHIDKHTLIWVVCFITLLYTVTGGLKAAFLSDTIQGIFILILSLILIPFGFAKINRIYGGSGAGDAFRILHEQLPEAAFEVFGSPSAMDFTWYYILAIGILGMLNTTVQPNMLVANGSARDEYTARFGFTVGCFLKRFCTVFWGLFALVAIVLYSESVHDPDLVWGHATLDLLGPLKLGLVGLMIACLMAAMMSTADCLMLTASSLLTQNLYKPLIPNQSASHYVWAGRLLGAAIVVGGAFIAIRFDTIFQLLKFIWEFNVMLAASFWLGMKWRRANRKAAWCSILATMFLFFVLPFALPRCVPRLRRQAALLETSRQQSITRQYHASEMDVRARNAEIAAWDKQPIHDRGAGSPPAPLVLGQTFEKRFVHAPKSIFWTQGFQSDADGRLRGKGDLNLGLFLLNRLGLDLSQRSHAANQTLRVTLRIIFPFVVLVGVALVTRPDDVERLNRFFVKMKTQVIVDPHADKAALEASYANPHQYDDRKLFGRHSHWEFDKWDRADTVGFVLSVLVVFAIIAMLCTLISIGG